MTKKEQTAQTALIREQFQCYKVGDIAAHLFLHGVSGEDSSYILEGGNEIAMRPYDRLQAFLAKVMDRMAERLPYETAKAIRQESACCISGQRSQIARGIFKKYDTIEERFLAFSKERLIIGGKAWKDGEDYYVSYWYDKPKTGYTCGCLRCIPEEPMNILWCECCAGHIKHHFETALGVTAECTCILSALSSCGDKACTFRLRIVDVKTKENR